MIIKRTLVCVTLLIFLAITIFYLSRSVSWQFMGKLIDRVETDQKVVALTFDDGPRPEYTQQILSILEEHDVKVTFYLVGNDIDRHVAETKLIINAGHEVGNHSYSHTRMVLKPLSFIEQEIETTDELISAAGQSGEIFFRPPYGKKLFVLPYFLSKTNRTSITWDVAPETALGMEAVPDELSSYVMANTKPGSIILMHVMYGSRKNSMDSVRDIILGLKSQGYTFLTVSELVAINK